jgi:hypothetical protein
VGNVGSTIIAKNTLKAVCATNLKKLTDWGFEVKDSSKSSPNTEKKAKKVKTATA